jgi:hypothetical protein
VLPRLARALEKPPRSDQCGDVEESAFWTAHEERRAKVDIAQLEVRRVLYGR